MEMNIYRTVVAMYFQMSKTAGRETDDVMKMMALMYFYLAELFFFLSVISCLMALCTNS